MINPVSTPIPISSLEGMQNAQAQLEAAAGKIARLPAALQNPEPGDTVDLSAEMIALMSARDNFMANVGAAKSGDAIERALLNMVP